MKRQFQLLALLALGLLFFNACNKEKTQALGNAKDMVDQYKKEAEEAWDAFQAAKNNGELSTRDKEDPKGKTCNCSYEILDIDVQTPPGLPEFEVDFWSTADCDPFNPNACTLFSGLYFSGPYCGTIINPACVDDWSGGPFPPTGLFPFNCSVPANSSFPVSFGGIGLNNGCAGGDLENFSVTYRIHCQPGPGTCEDTPVPVNGFSSPPITMTKQPIFNSVTETVYLGGCGCQPSVNTNPCDPLPPVFVCCTDWGFCLCDGAGNILSNSPAFANTSILWSAPSQYAGYEGQCLSFDNGPGPLPQKGEKLRFTIRRGECYTDYELTYDCE